MKIFKYSDKFFQKQVDSLKKRRFTINEEIEPVVQSIIKDVFLNKDKALFKYTKKFDHFSINKKNIAVTKKEIDEAYKKADKKNITALKKTAGRIKAFHKHQVAKGFQYKDKAGSTLGQIVTPLESVGLYVPGGKASYPSSVLMNAVPAKIAGVQTVIMCCPTPNNEINPYVLIAADIARIDKIFKVGGAQAVGAMAYGTETVPAVDKIVGPGNIYVAIAKKIVFGQVDIDMIAGPSEILVIADKSARADFIALDLLSQAEHDEMALSILATPDENLAKSVEREIPKQIKNLQRKEIINKSLKDNMTIFITKNLKQAVDISNIFAPEHLELAVSRPFNVLKSIKHAGSIFLGHYTPESVGDYAAGPNHVLPTGGTARFFSPLGVYDFQKRSSIISMSKAGSQKIGKTVETIALLEGLDAHAKAMTVRHRP